MLLWVIFTTIQSIQSLKVVEYKLWKNYGQIIYDYSLNKRHGRNGHSIYNLDYDTKFTDRGAYFSDYSMIGIPPMSINTTGFNLNINSALIFWVNSFDTSGRIYMRWKENNYIWIYRDSTAKRACCHYRGNSQDVTFCTSSNTWPSSTWVLLNLKINPSDMQIGINLNQIFTMSLSFSESGDYTSHFIGTDQAPDINMRCFVWYFLIIEGLGPLVDPFIKSAPEQNCYVGSCACNPAMNLPDIGAICVSTSLDVSKDSLGNACVGADTCWNSKSLACKCSSQSCVLENLSNCGCIDFQSELNLRTTCNCILQGLDCCNVLCKSCNDTLSCLECKIENTFPTNNGFCSCAIGFYGDKPLSKCTKCLDECYTCETGSSCLTCKDVNAEVKSNNLCACKIGYYLNYDINISECKLCLKECSSCSNDLTCITCKDINSHIDDNGRCKCNYSYYEKSLNGE